jgi:hypothetical protein
MAKETIPKELLDALPKPRLSREMIEAASDALFSAFCRRADEIGLEDFLLGLRQTGGKKILGGFENGRAVEELIRRACPKGIRLRRYLYLLRKQSILLFSALFRARSNQPGNVGYVILSRRQSNILRAVHDQAREMARENSSSEVTIEHALKALAVTAESREWLEQRGIRVRRENS